MLKHTNGSFPSVGMPRPALPPKPSRMVSAVPGAPAMVAGPASVGGPLSASLPYVYRADHRPPSALSAGFVPHYTMEVPALREFLRACAGVAIRDRDSLARHVRQVPLMGEVLSPGAKLTPFDLHRSIIQFNPKGPWVSTDPDRDCGGYTTGRFVYRIDMGRMKQIAWKEAFPGSKEAKQWPRLLIDGNTVDDSSHFALHAVFGATKEVTFLGVIPAAWIEPIAQP